MLREGGAAGLRPAPAEATATATAEAKAGFLWDGGVGPVAGDAVNPSMGAWPRLARVRFPAHTARPGLGVLPNPPEACLGPMPRTLPQPDPPRLRQLAAICRNDVLPWWVSTLVDTVDPRHAWMTHSISDRCVDQGRHLPTAARNKAAVANSRVNLSKVGRCGWAGPLAPWMAPSSPLGRLYGVSCPPTPPRHPTECMLLLLLWLLHSLRRVQGAALPNPLRCLWEPARTARRSAC